MHESAHHAGADHHTATKPDGNAGANCVAHADVHVHPDFDGQPRPDRNRRRLFHPQRFADVVTQRGR